MLQPNTLQAGAYIVNSDGSGPVGGVQAAIPFGQDIQILTPPPAAGSILSSDGTITLMWAGGDPNSTVTVFLISHHPVTNFATYCRVLASAGRCTLPSVSLNGEVTTTSQPTQQGELIYQVDPNPASIPFSAPGLSLGGQATWRIQHSFQGFAIQ